jgi:adenylate cyclase class 2
MISKTEVRNTYLSFDPGALVGALVQRGARREERLSRETIFELPASAGFAPEAALVRVRDEGRGDAQSLAVWMVVRPGRDATEAGARLSNYEAGLRMSYDLGLEKRHYLEKLREVWRVGANEVIFDVYPGLPPFVVVEGPDEEGIRGLAAELGLVGEARGTSVEDLYLQHHGIPPGLPAELTFGDAGLTLGPLVARGRDLFEERLSAQRRRIAAL